MACLIRRLSILIAGAALVVVGTACSDDGGDASATKTGIEGACDHLNSVCASAQGFQKQDCSATAAAYAKLSDAEKAKTDSVVPCVMAASSCQPALQCVSNGAKTEAAPTTSSTPTTSKTDAGAACQHINTVCQGQSGFTTQDCSGSNAAYAQLNAQQKAAADAIAPCIMQAGTCQNALACLKQGSQ